MPPHLVSRLRVALGGALLLLVALAVKAPFLIEPPGRDQGIFLAEADMWLDGLVPYADVWENKPPGILMIYAGALATLGRDHLSVQIADLVAALLTAWLLAAAVARRLAASGQALPAPFPGGGAAGVAAGTLYLLYAGGVLFGGFWVTGQPEVFLDPLAAGALLAVTPPRGRPATAWRPVVAGVLVGLAVVLKYSALPLAVLAWPAATSAPSGRRVLAVARFALGVALAGGVVVGVFAAMGALDPMLDATVGFNLAYRERFALDPGDFVLSRVLGARGLLLPFYACLAFALGERAWRAARRGGPAPSDGLLGLGVALWVAGLAQVYWQGKFWDYHYHVVLLPLALVAGAALHRGWTLLRRVLPAPAVAGVLVVLVGLGLPGYAGYVADYLERHRLVDWWRGEAGDEAFLATYRWGETDYAYAETAAAAARVREVTAPDDPIQVWGYETGLYFLADRPPASRFVYDLPLAPVVGTLMREHHLDLLMADLERTPPALFIVVVRDANVVEPQDSMAQLLATPRLKGWLMAGYDPAFAVGDFRVFRRKAAAR